MEDTANHKEAAKTATTGNAQADPQITTQAPVDGTEQEAQVDAVIVTAKKATPARDAAVRVVLSPVKDVIQGLRDASELPGHTFKVVKELAQGDMTGAFLAAGDVADDISGIKDGAIAVSNPLGRMGGQVIGEGLRAKKEADAKKAMEAKETTPVAEPLRVANEVPVVKATLEIDPEIQAKLETIKLTKFDVAEASPAQPVSPSTSQGSQTQLAQNTGVSSR